MSINCVIASGRVSSPAKVVEGSDGSFCARWGFVSWGWRKSRRSDGYELLPNYLDCTLFGSRTYVASMAGKLVRGRQFIIEGTFQWNKWKDPRGRDLSKLQIVVSDIDDGGCAQGRRRQEPPLTLGVVRGCERALADVPDGSVPAEPDRQDGAL